MKRIIALLLSVALMLGLAFSVSSASGITLIAVNDSLPFSISAGTMPFYSNGTLYLPQSIFDAGALGIGAVYSANNNTLALTDQDGHQLVYYLSSGTAVTEDGNSYTVSATARNGIIFVPANYTMQYFGAAVSVLTSSGGHTVVRITTGRQVYDDELFLEKADNMIEYRVSQYLDAAEEPTDTTTPSSDPEDPDSPDEETAATVYLAFLGIDGAEALLDELSSDGCTATFFLTAEELAQNPSLVLEIAAAGHKIGIRLTGQEADPSGAAVLANDVLDRILHTRTLLVLAPAGYRDLLPEYVVIAQSTRTAATAAAQDSGFLLVCSQTADGVSALRTLVRANCTIRPVLETSQFS